MMVEVTKEQFYNAICPCDVISDHIGEYEHTLRLRNSRKVIATLKGYKSDEPFYRLDKDFFEESVK